jgi:hypothetical protein
MPPSPERIVGFSAGPWRCPINLVDHPTAYPVQPIRLRRDSSSKVRIRAQCRDCGHLFTFWQTSPHDPKLPISASVISPGAGLVAEVNRLRTAGMPWNTLKRRFNIDRKTLKKWFASSR